MRVRSKNVTALAAATAMKTGIMADAASAAMNTGITADAASAATVAKQALAGRK